MKLTTNKKYSHNFQKAKAKYYYGYSSRMYIKTCKNLINFFYYKLI